MENKNFIEYSCWSDFFAYRKEGISFIISPDRMKYFSAEDIDFLQANVLCSGCKKPISIKSQKCECELSQKELLFFIPKELQQKFLIIWQSSTDAWIKQGKAIRRKRRLKSIGGFHTKQDIEALYSIQNGTCAYCGTEFSKTVKSKAYQIDHIKPLRYSGIDFSNECTNWPSNLWLTCKSCNARKHSKSLAQFWKILEEEKGSEFIANRKKTLSQWSKEKRKLTNRRKKQLATIANDIAKQIFEILQDWEEIDDSYDLNVYEDGRLLTIKYGDISISLPLPSVSRVKQWQKHNIHEICRYLIRMASF